MVKMKLFGGLLLCLFLLSTAVFSAPVEDDELAEPKEKVPTDGKGDEKKSKDGCGKCDPSKCVQTPFCRAGLVRDRCGCCDVCGLEEGQLCNKDTGDRSDSAMWYGRCGVELECRVRTDVDRKVVGNQSICYCTNEKVYCGSNQVTYPSLCQLKAAIVDTNGSVVMESVGPCKTKPTILNKGKNQNVEAKKGSDISLRCETTAYPLPQFQWTFLRPNGVVKILPDDDIDVSISTRGGPLKYQVTSHILITNIGMQHEGTYGCLVNNMEGMDQMLVRVVVSSPEDEEKEEM